MNTVGLTRFVAAAAELIRLCSGLVGIYVMGMILWAAVQSHWGALSGRPHSLADLADQISLAAVCGAITLNAQRLSEAVTQLIATAPQNESSVLAVWQALANFVVTVVIHSIGASLAVGVATGAFSAQAAALTGQPQVLSSTWARLAGVVATGLITLLSVTLANAILQIVFR